MNTVFIYALVDPVTDKIRYIGKAADPTGRHARHRCTKDINHRGNWIRSLRELGLIPRLQVLFEVPEDNWQAWEKYTIRSYRKAGFDLVNETDGGEGNSGRPLSPETKTKLRNAAIERALPPPSWVGRRHSEETKNKIRRAKIGKTASEETRAKLSVARRGNRNALGSKHTSETKIVCGRASLKYWSAKK